MSKTKIAIGDCFLLTEHDKKYKMLYVGKTENKMRILWNETKKELIEVSTTYLKGKEIKPLNDVPFYCVYQVAESGIKVICDLEWFVMEYATHKDRNIVSVFPARTFEDALNKFDRIKVNHG